MLAGAKVPALIAELYTFFLPGINGYSVQTDLGVESYTDYGIVKRHAS